MPCLDLGPPDRASRDVSFRLDVDAIETENILVDHAVNAPVARFAKLLGRIAMRAPVAHCHQKFDDDLFEEARAVLKDAIQQVCAQCSVDSSVCRFDHLLRRRGRRLHLGSRGDRLGIVPTPVEVAKRRDRKQVLGIEAGGRIGQHLLPSRSYRKASALGTSQQSPAFVR